MLPLQSLELSIKQRKFISGWSGLPPKLPL